MIRAVVFTNHGSHGPIADGDKTGHLVPSVVDQPIHVSSFLPIVDLVTRNTGLKNQVGIASNRIEGIILHSSQALEYTWEISWCEMVEREQTTCLLARNMQRHRQISSINVSVETELLPARIHGA